MGVTPPAMLVAWLKSGTPELGCGGSRRILCGRSLIFRTEHLGEPALHGPDLVGEMLCDLDLAGRLHAAVDGGEAESAGHAPVGIAEGGASAPGTGHQPAGIERQATLSPHPAIR